MDENKKRQRKEYMKKYREKNKEKISESKKGICNMTAENKRKLIKVNSSYWKITKPNGDELIIKNLNEFCRQNSLFPNRMRQVSKGIFKQHKGYKVIKL